MKGSPISPRPAAKAAHLHPAGAGVRRPGGMQFNPSQ